MRKRAFALPFVLGVSLSFFGCNDSAAKRQAATDTKAAGDAAVVEKPREEKMAAEPKTTAEKPPPQGKAKAKQPPEDKERLVEPVVDYIIAYNLMGSLIPNQKMAFDSYKVQEWAMHRFASYDEPLELRVARSLAPYFNATYGPIKVDDPSFEAGVKAREFIVKVGVGAEQLGGKDENHISNTFLARRAGLQIEGNPQIREAADKLEKEFNDTLTPAQAADIARVAAMVKSITSQEQLDARKKTKDRLSEAVHNDPDIIKLFESTCATTDEMRRSRERVSELIKNAQKK